MPDLVSPPSVTDTVNPDGSVQRVITTTYANGGTVVQTIPITAAGYMAEQASLTAQLTALQDKVTATQAIAAQVQTALAAKSVATPALGAESPAVTS